MVARVNGQPVLIRQILPLAKSALAKYKEKIEREQHKPEALRGALEHYIDRELLLQEAIARGVRADTRQVDWAYDQMRREHRDDSDWEAFLLEQGLDPQSFKAELRAQHTVAALLADESRSYPVSEQELRDAYDANPMGFSPEGAKEPQLVRVGARPRRDGAPPVEARGGPDAAPRALARTREDRALSLSRRSKPAPGALASPRAARRPQRSSGGVAVLTAGSWSAVETRLRPLAFAA